MESELSSFESRRVGQGLKRAPQVGALELKLLKVFKAVVEARGFSAAQQQLGVSLASISKQVSDLEVRLGMRLCTRGREGFELSEEGDIVYRNSIELFRALDDFSDRISSSHRELIGELSIAVIDNTVSDPCSPLIETLGRLARDAPKVRLSVHIESLGGIEKGLETGRFSCALMPSYHALGSFTRPGQFERWIAYEEQSGLYCGRHHPAFADAARLSMPALSGYDFVSLNYVNDAQRRELASRFTRLSCATQVEAVAMLILSGAYLGVLPHHYARQYVEAGRMVRLAKDEFELGTPIELVRSQKSGSSAITCHFIDTLRAVTG